MGVSTRSILGVEEERADAGREGRTCLTRPNSQARTGFIKTPSIKIGFHKIPGGFLYFVACFCLFPFAFRFWCTCMVVKWQLS